MTHLPSILYFIIILGIMVLVHEFGHFAVAKLCGIRVETFSIGFGKRLFGLRRGDTDYRISMLPLGGYVKMAGDNPGEQATDPGDFNAHPRWQRVLVALAGPISNFILAFVIVLGVSMCHHEVQEYLTHPAVVDWVVAKSPAAELGMHAGDTIVHFDTVENPTWRDVFERSLLNLKQNVAFSYLHNGQRADSNIVVKSDGIQDDFDMNEMGFLPVLQSTPVQVLQLEAGMPAAEAGMQPKDAIVSIDGLPLHSVQALLAYMQDQDGKPATVGVLRDGQPLTIHLTPQISDAGDGIKQYRLGFRAMPAPTYVEKLPFRAAVSESRKSNWHDSKLILTVLRRLFGGKVSVKNLSGPVGIWQEVELASRMGIWTVLQVMASISLNLGIFNLLPFPVLDGGMILFLLVESIIRRDVSQVWKERIYQAAFIVIILFAAFVIFNDITKLSPFAKMKL
jgi:regulator of sigma E protease